MDTDADRERRRAARKSSGAHSNGRSAAESAEEGGNGGSSGGVSLHEGDVLSGRWTVGAKVGEGTFSRIYDALPATMTGMPPPPPMPHACVLKVNKKAPARAVATPLGPPAPPDAGDDSFAYEALVFRSVQAAEEKGAARQPPGAGPVPLSVPRLLDHQSHCLAMHPAGVGGSVSAVPCPNAPSGVEYMVLEKCGVDLSRLRYDWQARVGQQPPVALQLAIMCLTALERFHRAGYIHRDIKPSNFLTCLDFTEATQRVLITDFGLSRRSDAPSPVLAPGQQAVDNKFIGKSLYASFAAHKHEAQSARDDVASLLFVMLDLMFGTLPWKATADKRTLSQQQRWNLVLAEKERLLGPEVCRAAQAAREQPGDAHPPPSNEWLPGFPLPQQLRLIFHQLHSAAPTSPVDYVGIRAQLQQLHSELHSELHGQMASSGKTSVSLVELLQWQAEEARKQAAADAQRREDQAAEERRAMRKQMQAEQDARDAEKTLQAQQQYRANMAARTAQAAANAAQQAALQQQWQPVPSHAQPSQQGLLPMPRSAQQTYSESAARDRAAREGAAAAAALRGSVPGPSTKPPSYSSWPRRVRDLFGRLFGLHSDVHAINLADGLPAPVAAHSLEALWDAVDWGVASRAASTQQQLLRARFTHWNGDWQHVYDGLADLRLDEVQGLASHCSSTPSPLPAALASAQPGERVFLVGIAANIAFLYDLAQQARKGLVRLNGFSSPLGAAARPAAAASAASGTAAGSAARLKQRIPKRAGADSAQSDTLATPHADIAAAVSASPPAPSTSTSAAAAAAAGSKREKEKEKEKDAAAAAAVKKLSGKDGVAVKKEVVDVKKEPAAAAAAAKKDAGKAVAPAPKPKAAPGASVPAAAAAATTTKLKLEGKLAAVKLEEKKPADKVAGGDKKPATAAAAAGAAPVPKERKSLPGTAAAGAATSTSAEKRPIHAVQSTQPSKPKLKLKSKASRGSSSDSSSSSSSGSDSDSSDSDSDSDDEMLYPSKPAPKALPSATATAAAATGGKPSRPPSSADAAKKPAEDEKAKRKLERKHKRATAKEKDREKAKEKAEKKKQKKAAKAALPSSDESGAEEEGEEEEAAEDADEEGEGEAAALVTKSKRQLETEAAKAETAAKAKAALEDTIVENFLVAAHNFLLGGPALKLLQKPEEFALPSSIPNPIVAAENAAISAAAAASVQRVPDPHFDASIVYANINLSDEEAAAAAAGEARKKKTKKETTAKKQQAKKRKSKGGDEDEEEEAEAEDAAEEEDQEDAEEQRLQAEKKDRAEKARLEKEAKKAAAAARKAVTTPGTTRASRRRSAFQDEENALQVEVTIKLPPKAQEDSEAGSAAAAADVAATAAVSDPTAAGAATGAAAPAAAGLSINPDAAALPGDASVDTPSVTPGGRKRGRPLKAQSSGGKRPKRGATPVAADSDAAAAAAAAAAPGSAPATPNAPSAQPNAGDAAAAPAALPPVPEADADAETDASAAAAVGAKRKLSSDETADATAAPDSPASKKQRKSDE